MAYDPRWDTEDRPFAVGARGRGGVSRGRLRHRRFRVPTTGVRVRASAPDSLPLQLAALRLVLQRTAVAYGLTAAQLHGLPVPWPAEYPRGPVHVAVRAGSGHHPRRSGVRASRVTWAAGDVVMVRGLRVTSPARTFADLAAELSLPDLVAVGDALLRRGMARPLDLAGAVRRAEGRRGVVRARRGLALLEPRSESPQESRLRVVIIEGGLPAPVPNQDIRDECGEVLARGDLVYAAARIVIEYDGKDHDAPRRRASDATRRTLLREHGWYVVEITADDLRFPERALAKVRAALRTRGVVS